MNYLNGADDPESLAQAVEALVKRRGHARLQAALENQLTCDQCHLLLVDYATAVDQDLPFALEMQAVEQHLAHCESCHTDYVALQALSRSTEAKDWSAVPTPAPDLSFLTPNVATQGLRLWQQVESARYQLRSLVDIAWSQTAVWFATWPSGLTPQVVPTPVLRDGVQPPPVQRLVLPAADGELSFELTITPNAPYAQIAVGVFQKSLHQPLGQVVVTLLNHQRQRLHRADTGADGIVHFAELLPGSYYLQVRTHKSQWEVMIVVNEAHSP
jgi:hypothetical protein